MEDLSIAISMFGYTFMFGIVALVIYENFKRRKQNMDNLWLVGQGIGLLCLGLLAIVVIAYSWIYVMVWLKDKEWI